jgi:SET domain-containing protein
MMNDEDIKEYHNLDRLKQYQPLPSGLTIADSGISGQGLFATRRLVMGTSLGISHYRIDGEYIRTPLGGFINHADGPNCKRSQVRVRPGFDRWNIVVIEDIEEGEELTLKYKMYDPQKK